MKYSIGFIIGENYSECGYCKSNTESCTSFGIWMYALSVEQYQLMIDKGWRRSGKYLYKPDLANTCCPPYSIRLDTSLFIPSKSQTKILKKMQRYLFNGDQLKGEITQIEMDNDAKSESFQEKKLKGPPSKVKVMEFDNVSSGDITTRDRDKEIQVISNKSKVGSVQNKEKSPMLNRKDGIGALFAKIESCNESKHRFVVELCPSHFSQDVYDLYVEYQVSIHHEKKEDLTEKKFSQFLVDSPLQRSGQEGQYGSFFQKYFIDDKLIAVGFLDILPRCVSSVYFIYNKKYAEFSLGTLSGLREIAETQTLNVKYPALKYYYLGYYIHSCPKMSYKARFSPSELLCPLDFVWFPAPSSIQLIQADKATILSNIPNNDENRKVPLTLSAAPKETVLTQDILKVVKLLKNNEIIRLEPMHTDFVKFKHLIGLSGTDILQNLLFVTD